MSNCTTGCTSQDHTSFGDCLRAKSLGVLYSNSAKGLDLTTEKKWQKDIDFARSAYAQGVELENTRPATVRRALEISDRTGTAYQAPGSPPLLG